MTIVEHLQFSLGASFDILRQVTADLTQEQADWRPPGTVNTIGPVYSHILTYVDYYVRSYFIDGEPQPVTVESRPAELWMQDDQADLPELHEFANEVGRGEETTAGELSLGQAFALFIVWHIDAHYGEIAAVKGCQGLEGYPW